MKHHSLQTLFLVPFVLIATAASEGRTESSFATFESSQAQPLAMSPAHRVDALGRERPAEEGSFDEHAAFVRFRGAAAHLLGMSARLPEDDMERSTNFILPVAYPTTPIQPLDDVPTPQQATGHAHFEGIRCGIDPAPPEDSFAMENCATCH